MAQFLSDEWIDEMAEAVAASDDLSAAAADLRLGVQQVVTTDPAVRYWVRLHDGEVRIGPGVLDDADVVFEADPATAAGLATGAVSTQDAVASGGLRITGDVAAMIRQAPSLGRIGDVLAEVRARTTY